jgi:hypothetical protein
LRLLVQGLANKEIAAQMEISESAVKNAIQQLFAKTGVRARSQLVRVALAANWSGWRSNSTEASCEAGNVRPIKRLAGLA